MRLLSALLLLLGVASAAGVEIRSAQRLYLDPGGELVVIEGDPVVLEYRGRRLEARRVVYHRGERRLALSGGVRYTDPDGHLVVAEELVVFLEDEGFLALEVSLRAGMVEFRAPSACRVGGRVEFERADFSPCYPCGQDPADYSFSAERVIIYPGDRVVAFGVQVYFEGEPGLRLPALVIFTGPRRPRLELGRNDEDGLFLVADLPYVTEGGLGFTLLRYFERRGLGGGFDHWELGQAREHYRLLYLPPPPGGDRGLLEVLLSHRSEEGGWERNFTLSRDDARVPGRFLLEAEVSGGEEPKVTFRLKRTLDTDPEAPPLRGVELGPELSLRWKKGLKLSGLSVTGRVVVGAYSAPPDRSNRSARAAGDMISAGRLLVEHHERYRRRWPFGLSLSLGNDFTGYYYTTEEVQVSWRSRAELGYRRDWFRARLKLFRDVREGETPFAFEHLPERARAELAPRVELGERGLSFSVEGGWRFYRREFSPLVATAKLVRRPYDLGATYRRDLNRDRPLDLVAWFKLAPRPWSLSLESGYDWEEGGYREARLRVSYALAGGSLGIFSRYDPNQGRFLKTSGELNLRRGERSLYLKSSWDHLAEVFQGSLRLGAGPAWARLSLAYPRPDGVPDGEDDLEGRLDLKLGLGYGRHRLELSGAVFGDGWEYRTLAFYSGASAPEGRWDLALKLHLPDREDPGAYLSQLSLRGGVEFSRWLALQGGLGYRREGERETLSLKNFGLTVALSPDPPTRVYLSALVSQELDLSSGDPEPLRPKLVLSYDRCCWGMRFTMDTAREEVRLELLYQGRSAGLSVVDGELEFSGGAR